MKYCIKCGGQINDDAIFCPKCGAKQNNEKEVTINVSNDLKSFASSTSYNVSDKSRAVCALLAFFLGTLGIHRFYMGKTTSGVLMLLFCWTGIPAIIGFIDFIIILCGSAKDSEGKEIKAW